MVPVLFNQKTQHMTITMTDDKLHPMQIVEIPGELLSFAVPTINYSNSQSQDSASSSGKHAHDILYGKTGVYRGKPFFLFLLQNRLWVLVRTASPSRGGSNVYPQAMF